LPRTRRLTVMAQDPAVTRPNGQVVMAKVRVPAESLEPGPRGHRVHVIDYDATTDTLYAPRGGDLDVDPYEGVADREALTADPGFHAQNVYAIVMATLAHVERALGRRVRWGFRGRGHQIKVAPHAFSEANAFYSRLDEALMFGYFPGRRGPVFTCLSHDVIAHETTHAILDGLRPRFLEPSSPDQAAFHEGFADVVALLSVFSLPEVVDTALGGGDGVGALVAMNKVTAEQLRTTVLFGLADQMGAELGTVRGHALRESANLAPSTRYLSQAEFELPHRRGEVFSAAMLNSFLQVWTRRLAPLFAGGASHADRSRVVEEGAAAAQHLLTMAVRALDYTPPVDLQFGDYVSALLTADTEAYPDDTRFRYRDAIRQTFALYGIEPAKSARPDGLWKAPSESVRYGRSHFEAMQRDREEVFRFVWENQKALELDAMAYTYVDSVRPCTRVDVDGVTLHEAVCEYVQIANVRASELGGLGIAKPKTMPDATPVTLYGGAALVFDEFGRLKYQVGSHIWSERQSERLEHLWEAGFFHSELQPTPSLAKLHRNRATGHLRRRPQEAW
ncbi:MAG: hypothetical protein KC731_36460, partial [Myxococcales bacterium]|nr:hypothetical protein [Myxococcales bacterium]